METKISYLNMAGPFSGSIMLENLDGGFVVNIDRGSCSLSVEQFSEDTTKVLGYFAAGVGSNKLGFSGVLGRDGLGVGSICHSAS